MACSRRSAPPGPCRRVPSSARWRHDEHNLRRAFLSQKLEKLFLHHPGFGDEGHQRFFLDFSSSRHRHEPAFLILHDYVTPSLSDRFEILLGRTFKTSLQLRTGRNKSDYDFDQLDFPPFLPRIEMLQYQFDGFLYVGKGLRLRLSLADGLRELQRAKS